jgi:hypothetical protein
MPLISMGRRYSAGAPAGGTLTNDAANGVGYSGGGSVSTSFTITVSTTKTNDIIILGVIVNASGVSTITSANVTWASRASGTVNIEEWYGVSAAILTNEVITITVVGGAAFCAGIALVINGADISSPPTSAYDPNGSLPATGASGTPSGISTTKNKTMVYGMVRGNTDGSVASGYTDVAPGTRGTLFMAMEYQIFSSPQSGIGIADTMTSVNGWRADAIQASGQ